jgi:hypothetical protein
MSHFAQIDEQNIVLRVIVAEQDFIDSGIVGDPASWIQTSYNTRGGVYYTPNSDPYVADPDQSKAFRKNFAAAGFLWLPNGPGGAGFAPPSLYPSWTMNEFSYLWQAPIPQPSSDYMWDEENLCWFVPLEVLATGLGPTTSPDNQPAPNTNSGSAPNVVG